MNNRTKFVALFLLVSSNLLALAQEKDFSKNVHCIDSITYLYHYSIKIDTQAIEANGLIVEGKDSVVVVETPWDLTQTIQLINWITEYLKKPVGLVIVTHAHPNRFGGVSIILNDQFPIYGSTLVAQEALKNGFRPPDYRFVNDTTFYCSGITIETFYPGQGRVQENEIIYFPKSDILFGGSFLENTTIPALGNMGNADLTAWLQSIKRLKEKYPHPKIVIPGVGNWEAGRIEATEELLKNAMKKPVEK